MVGREKQRKGHQGTTRTDSAECHASVELLKHPDRLWHSNRNRERGVAWTWVGLPNELFGEASQKVSSLACRVNTDGEAGKQILYDLDHTKVDRRMRPSFPG